MTASDHRHARRRAVRPAGSAATAGLLLAAGFIACAEDPRTVPGTLPAGRVACVHDRARTHAPPPCAEGDEAADAAEGMPAHLGLAAVPAGPPGVPVVAAARVQAVWFVPRISHDRQSRREGFWVYTIIDPARWFDEPIVAARIPLGPDGPPPAQPIPAGPAAAGGGPWAPAPAAATRTTVVIDRPGEAGGPAWVQSTTSDGSALPGIDPATRAPDPQALHALIERARTQIRAAVPAGTSPSPPAGTAAAVPGTP